MKGPRSAGPRLQRLPKQPLDLARIVPRRCMHHRAEGDPDGSSSPVNGNQREDRAGADLRRVDGGSERVRGPIAAGMQSAVDSANRPSRRRLIANSRSHAVRRGSSPKTRRLTDPASAGASGFPRRLGGLSPAARRILLLTARQTPPGAGAGEGMLRGWRPSGLGVPRIGLGH